MDVQMPEMDGVTATKQLRKMTNPDLENKEIPVIAMTAHAITGDREKYLDSGMNDYLAKPVTPENLATILQKWLETSNASPLSTPPPAVAETPDADSTAEQEIWNYNTIRNRVLNDDEAASAILWDFLRDMPEYIRKLHDAFQENDLNTVQTTAHTICGAAANIGADALTTVAQLIREQSMTMPTKQLEIKLNTLENQFTKLEKMIHQHLNSLNQ